MRLRKRLIKSWIHHFGSMPNSKQFRGNQFERLEGFDYILNRCKGMSVLDIGSNNGLILYEFAKRGAKEITGVEIDKRLVNFSNTLFQYTEIPYKFINWDLLNHPPPIKKTDIVLFIAVFHHLSRQTAYLNGYVNENLILSYVKFYLEKTRKYFVLCPTTSPKLNQLILDTGFKQVHSINRKPGGTVIVYKRI